MEVVLHLRRVGYLAMGMFIALVAASVWLSTSTGAVHWAASAVWVVLVPGPSAVYRRALTITDEGLTIRRSFGRYFCPWSEIVVEHHRLGTLTVNQLQMRGPVRRHVSYSSTAPPEVTWRPTSSKRVFIGLYDKRWRNGPIGVALAAQGVSLEATTPDGG